MVTCRWALESARHSLTSTSIREESMERVLRGEADAMRLERGIFAAAIQLTEKSGGASGGGGGG